MPRATPPRATPITSATLIAPSVGAAPAVLVEVGGTLTIVFAVCESELVAVLGKGLSVVGPPA